MRPLRRQLPSQFGWQLVFLAVDQLSVVRLLRVCPPIRNIAAGLGKNQHGQVLFAELVSQWRPVGRIGFRAQSLKLGLKIGALEDGHHSPNVDAFGEIARCVLLASRIFDIGLLSLRSRIFFLHRSNAWRAAMARFQGLQLGAALDCGPDRTRKAAIHEVLNFCQPPDPKPAVGVRIVDVREQSEPCR